MQLLQVLPLNIPQLNYLMLCFLMTSEFYLCSWSLIIKTKSYKTPLRHWLREESQQKCRTWCGGGLQDFWHFPFLPIFFLVGYIQDEQRRKSLWIWTAWRNAASCTLPKATIEGTKLTSVPGTPRVYLQTGVSQSLTSLSLSVDTALVHRYFTVITSDKLISFKKALLLGYQWLEQVWKSLKWKRNDRHPIQITKLVCTAQPYVNHLSTNQHKLLFSICPV